MGITYWHMPLTAAFIDSGQGHSDQRICEGGAEGFEPGNVVTVRLGDERW
jgi:hypothetical protein